MVLAACSSKAGGNASATNGSASPSQSASSAPTSDETTNAACEGVSQDVCTAWEQVQFRPLPSWLELPPASTLAPAGGLAGATEGEGPQPEWYNALKITPQQVQEIRSKHLTAAILNWSDAVYNVAIANGAKHVFDAVGIKVIAETNWNFDPGTLSRQLSSVLLKHPDIILTGGTLTPQNAPQILAPAVNQKVTIALMSAGADPKVWTPGKQFANFISYPTFLLGETIADAVHKAYPDGANIGMVYWKTTTPIVVQRDNGFVDGLKKYPNLHLVVRSGFADPAQAGSVASAMLLKYKDLDVVYAPWDSPPGDEIVAAIRASGNTKMKMVSLDIGTTGAKGILDGSIVLEESAEDVYDWGTTAALSAALSTIGQKVPPFLVTPVYACTKDNLTECWDFMHGPGLPLPTK
jgi:ribose transport system substrate-binding protein